MERYEKYKESGIDWLGEIPEHWKSTKLKFISLIRGRIGFRGYTVNDLVLENQGALALGAKHINDKNKLDLSIPTYISWEKYYESPEIMIEPDNIILVQRGSLGKLALINKDIKEATINPSLILLKEIKQYSNYLYYFLNSIFIQSIILEIGSKTAVPMLSQDQASNFQILNPPLEEQKTIALYLDRKTAEIDKLIAQKERLIGLYEEEKTAIINQAVTKGINPDVKLKPTGIDWLGDIPEHWEVKRLRYLGNFQNGVSKAADYFGLGYPFINYTDVYNNIELPQEVEGLAKSTDEDRISYSVKKGDIFFTRTSETIEEIGIASTCLQSIKNAIFSGFLIRFRPLNGLLLTEFSKYYFRSYVRELFFVKEMNIVTRASLSQELLKRLPVLLPSLKEQKAIAEYIETEVARIDAKIAKTKRIIELQKEYRTALISEAVTGKIKVPELAT